MTRSKRIVLLALVMAILALTAFQCNLGGATLRIRRDTDTTDFTERATYNTGGARQEDQGVLVMDSSGTPLGRVVFESSGGSRFEYNQRFNAARGVFETISMMMQYDTAEDIFRIRGASYIMQHLLRPGGPDLVVPKSEMKFRYLLTLNKVNDQDFEIACLYRTAIPEGEELSGEEIITRAEPWYAKLTYKTIISEQWSPYTVSLTGTPLCETLPANWAQMNEAYDEAILRARDLVHDLEWWKWSSLSSDQGEIYKMVGNPTGLRDIFGFQSSFPGWAIGSDGMRYNFRFVPRYSIFHTDRPEFGWPKQHSRNYTLEALVLEIEEDGVYRPKAVLFFTKSWWSKSSLYALKKLELGESPEAVMRRAYDLISEEIPDDVRQAYHERDTETVARWSAAQPPFSLEQVDADFVGVVDIIDVTEELTGVTSEREKVKVAGPPQKKGTYHLRGDPMALDYFLALLGEHAVELLDLGYIQPNGGDGIGFVAGILNALNHYEAGADTFDDAARLDQRSPESPEMVQAALDYFRR